MAPLRPVPPVRPAMARSFSFCRAAHEGHMPSTGSGDVTVADQDSIIHILCGREDTLVKPVIPVKPVTPVRPALTTVHDQAGSWTAHHPGLID